MCIVNPVFLIGPRALQLCAWPEIAIDHYHFCLVAPTHCWKILPPHRSITKILQISGIPEYYILIKWGREESVHFVFSVWDIFFWWSIFVNFNSYYVGTRYNRMEWHKTTESFWKSTALKHLTADVRELIYLFL